MKTQVSLLHQTYPSRMRRVVDERLSGLTRFYDRIVSVSARLERGAREHRVELVAHVGGGSVLVAEVRRDGLRKALDEALDRMGRQLRKHHDKERLERRRRA